MKGETEFFPLGHHMLPHCCSCTGRGGGAGFPTATTSLAKADYSMACNNNNRMDMMVCLRYPFKPSVTMWSEHPKTRGRCRVKNT